MITKELQNTLNAALEEAIKRGHEYVTLEHLLFALLNDQTASTVVVQCGGDSEALKAGLEQFFDEQQEGLRKSNGSARTDSALPARAAVCTASGARFRAKRG